LERTERSVLRHDLRGPLNTIALTLEVVRRRLLRDGGLDDTSAEAFDRMRDEVQRLDELIRIRLADPEPADSP